MTTRTASGRVGAGTIIKLFLAFLVPCALAACWDGDAWYDPGPSPAALAPGDYQLVEPGKPAEDDDLLQIRQNGDGSLTVAGETPWRIVTVPFGPTDEKRYIIQAQKIEGEGSRPGALFLLMEVRDGRYLITILPCGGAAREAVKRSGGFVSRDPNSASSCTFTDRAVFEKQLGVFIASPDRTGPDMELVRVER